MTRAMTQSPLLSRTAMKKRIAVAGALLPCFLLVPGSARAADGALEISQACVATGCVPGDAPGLPVTTQTGGRYVLTSDLTLPTAGSSGVLLEDFATLDLRGFAIVGPATCSGSPAVCSNTGGGIGVVIGTGGMLRNGTIRGAGGPGVVADEVLLIEDVAVLRNGGVGISGDTAGGIIRGCRVFGNGGHGVNLALGSGGPGTLITGSTVQANGGDGIRAAEANILANTIIENGGLGLALNFVSGDAGFAHNVIRNNNGGNANPQTSGGNQLGTNVCATDTVCP